MTNSEQALLKSFYQAAKSYLEFGAGGSTVFAAQYVGRIITVESSSEWLNKVAVQIPGNVRFSAHLADIGPVRDLGYPLDDKSREQWPAYSTSVWHKPDAHACDLYLIDGRFRVCCFAESLIRAKNGAIILIHDFENRPQYHVVKALCRNVAIAENLSAFVKDNSSDLARAKAVANEYRFVPE